MYIPKSKCGGHMAMYVYYRPEQNLLHATSEGAWESCHLPYRAVFAACDSFVDAVGKLPVFSGDDSLLREELETFRTVSKVAVFVGTIHLTTQISMALIPIGAMIGTIQGIKRRRAAKK